MLPGNLLPRTLATMMQRDFGFCFCLFGETSTRWRDGHLLAFEGETYLLVEKEIIFRSYLGYTRLLLRFIAGVSLRETNQLKRSVGFFLGRKVRVYDYLIN